jgi:hypothetical protein
MEKATLLVPPAYSLSRANANEGGAVGQQCPESSGHRTGAPDSSIKQAPRRMINGRALTTLPPPGRRARGGDS